MRGQRPRPTRTRPSRMGPELVSAERRFPIHPMGVRPALEGETILTGMSDAQAPRAPPRPRRSPRSPTTGSSRTATLARSSRPTGRSTGCVFRASTRPVCSAASWIEVPAPSGSAHSASTTLPRASTAGDERPRDDVADADRLGARPHCPHDGPADARRRDHATHPAAGRRRRRAHARAHRRMPRRPRRGRADLRAGLRLRPGGGRMDAGRRRPPHCRRDRGRAHDPAPHRPRHGHRGQPRTRTTRAGGR